MNTDNIQSLEELVRQAGEGWLLDWFSPREKAGDYLRALLARVHSRAQELFPQAHLSFSQESLIAEYKRSPHKVRAFIQALGESNSPAMLIMVWRVLQGMEIAQIDVRYVLSERFSLTVVLRSPDGDPDESYHSDDIDDAALLRHIGIMKMDGRPVFDGFYPIEKQGNEQ